MSSSHIHHERRTETGDTSAARPAHARVDDAEGAGGKQFLRELLIRNLARVATGDLAAPLAEATAIYCEDGVIREVGTSRTDADVVLDGNGLLAAPGLIDSHSHPSFGDFTFTGGIRYSHERKYGTESVSLLCFGLPACLGGIPPEIFAGPLDLTGVTTVVAGGTGAPLDTLATGVVGPTRYDPATGFASRDYDAKWSKVTGTAKLEWHPDDDTLGYLSYSKGYRSGGFNIGIFTVLSGVAVA